MKKIMLVAVTSLLLISSCVDGSSHKYPAAVADNFISSCEKNSGGQKEMCSCFFDRVQQEYTYDEFAALEAKIKAKESTPEFLQFMDRVKAECAGK